METIIRSETEVALRFGVSRPTLQRWRRLTAAGIPTGPRAIKIGPRRIGYREDDLQSWIDSASRQAA
jgi:predicted DNA-binding transcriptional regulator AlpA